MEEKKQDNNDHVVCMGEKPFMNYVTGVIMQFTTQSAEEVVIKARGKFISRAVDVAEVSSRRFLDDSVEIKGIEIGSEEFKNKENKDVRVSFIEISLRRKK